MSAFDLNLYLEGFPKVCEREFGRHYNFRALEKNFSYLRKGDEWLSAKHVTSLFNEDKTPFAKYWQKPDEKELDRILRQKRMRLALPADGSRDGELIRNLLDVLHNMGTASLVLRFTHPERFGTFSTPVLHLLQIHRESTIDLYLAYCAELAEWQRHFGMNSVADTETALWAFHKLASGSPRMGANAQARAGFDADIWIQRRRVAQVLRPFLQKYGPLELARLLVYENPKLGGMIAGEEYERLLRFAARVLGGGMNLTVKGATETLFNRLVDDGRISLEDKTLLARAWRTRNAAVHAGDPPDPEQVENMIDTIERLCCPWEKPL